MVRRWRRREPRRRAPRVSFRVLARNCTISSISRRGRGLFPRSFSATGLARSRRRTEGCTCRSGSGKASPSCRFDKRGSGQSTGTYRGVSAANSFDQILELAGDMAAGVAFLKARSDIDGTRIGLTGVSQAGWVMVAATTLTTDVRFVVAVVGSVVPIGVNIAWEDLRTAPIDQAYGELSQYTGPRGWDPLPALRATSAPVLYLLGADDRLVPTRVCAPIVNQLRDQGVPRGPADLSRDWPRARRVESVVVGRGAVAADPGGSVAGRR